MLRFSRPDSSDSDYYNLGVKSVLGDLMFRSESIEDQNDAIDIGSEALEEDEQSIATMSITTPSENPSNTSYNKRKDLVSLISIVSLKFMKNRPWGSRL